MFMLVQGNAGLWWIIPTARLAEFEGLRDRAPLAQPVWMHGPFVSPEEIQFSQWREQ